VTVFLEPISLGYSCDVKYQVSRNLYFRWFPDHSETQFRNMLFRWLRQPTRFRRHIFDWMIAPLPAVCAYLESDFQGVFERADLELHEDGRKVRHRDLLTIHPHDFRPGKDGLYTEEIIDRQYAEARAKFEYLAERFRQHLRTPGPYLYVFKEIRALDDVERLRKLLQARSPHHLFQLLLVDNRGAVNQVLNQLKGQAVKGWLPGGGDKPPERRWEGDDAAWDAILNRFELDLHADGGAVHDGPPPWAIRPPPPVFDLRSPPASGWRPLIEADGAEAFLSRFDFVDPLDPAVRAKVGEHGVMVERPSPEAHFFCHFQPVAVLADAAWVRLELAWPEGSNPAERMAVSLQDQDCRNYRMTVEPTANGLRAWTRVSWDVDDLRLVFTPAPGARSAAPVKAVLEVHGPGVVPAGEVQRQAGPVAEYQAPAAPAPAGWWSRLKGAFG
jgi:hypothetical protein